MPTCSAAAHGSSDYPVKHRNRSEFVTAETELNAMAAPASIGLSKIPKNGYSVPGAAVRALSPVIIATSMLIPWSASTAARALGFNVFAGPVTSAIR
jgi:hypothetical protein